MSSRSMPLILFLVSFLLAKTRPTLGFGPRLLPSRQKTFPGVVVGSEPVRNGKMDPIAQSDDRDELVQKLQSEIANLYSTIAEQKDDYQTNMEKLQKDADLRVKEAKINVESIRQEYESYKEDVRRKLENAATPAELARLQEEIQVSAEKAEIFKRKLDDALSQLHQNREDRKKLMGEMVALKESYIDKLNELEDQLEFVQDERVRDQQEGAKRMAEIENENKLKLKDAIEEGRKKVDELTLDYTRRIAVKDEELAQTRVALEKARQQVQEKDEVIEQLEDDARSIRKLLGKSVSLAKRRVGKRLRSLVPGKRSQEEQ